MLPKPPEGGSLPEASSRQLIFVHGLPPTPNHSVSHRRTLYHATRSIPCFVAFHPRSNTSSQVLFARFFSPIPPNVQVGAQAFPNPPGGQIGVLNTRQHITPPKTEIMKGIGLGEHGIERTRVIIAMCLLKGNSIYVCKPCLAHTKGFGVAERGVGRGGLQPPPSVFPPGTTKQLTNGASLPLLQTIASYPWFLPQKMHPISIRAALHSA